jgi:hypothetical protein
MSYQFPEYRKFPGLHLQANSFSVPDGAFEEANNVVINTDDRITKIRGFYEYFNGGVPSLNSLFFYRNALFAAYSSKLSYFTNTGSSPNETGSETVCSGSTVAVTGTRISRSVQQNSNLYFTTDNGVLKVETATGTPVIYDAGIAPSLDLRGLFDEANGPINAHTITGNNAGNASTIAYRVVFGRRDANENLNLGAPSDVLSLTNQSTDSYTSSGAGPYTITVTTSVAHLLSPGDLITVVNATSPNAGSTVSSPTFSVVATPTTNTFTYSVTSNPASGTLTWATTRSVRLEISIPSQIPAATASPFVQIYRSEDQTTTGVPDPTYRLVAEQALTSGEISAGVMFYTDETDDILLSNAPELYTNQNSREGELQANERPPLCDDVTLYKSVMIYGKTTSRHSLNLDVIDPSSLTSGDYVQVSLTNTRRYVARTGVGNENTQAKSATFVSTTITVNYDSHGLAVGDTIRVTNAVGTGTLPDGVYEIATSAANSFTFIAGTAPTTLSTLSFQGLNTRQTAVTGVSWVRAANVVTVTSTTHGLSTGMTVYVSNSAGGTPNVGTGNKTITVTGANTFTFSDVAADDASGNTLDYQVVAGMFTLDAASASISTRLRRTAQGLVKAINRDSSSEIYARYVSGTTGTPGKMTLQAKGFGSAFSLTANTATVGAGFSPALPTSGTTVISKNDSLPHTFFASKELEPEAVPLVNFFTVGSKIKAIQRVVALRDSLIVIKEDGVFRVSGDTPSTFSITLLDGTVFCVAPDSVAVINNEIYMLANQGVCRVTESSVEIISRVIEDVIIPIVGKATISAQTGAIGYESDRTYRLATVTPTGTTRSTIYLFNVFNQSWTTSDVSIFLRGVVGPSDTLFVITTDNRIHRERKNQNRLDYSGQNDAVTVVSVASDKMSAVITPTTQVPAAGDILVKDEVFSRIRTVTLSGTDYAVTFATASNILAADSVTSYKGYVSEVRFAPFHAGLVGRTKQFGQMQLHLRTANLSRFVAAFSGQIYGGSEETIWLQENVGQSTGWGNEPFGFFPWGLNDGIDNVTTTQAAPVIRLYVPRFQQRTTFIQPILTHREAGESIDIQALTFAVRAYNERVSQ